MSAAKPTTDPCGTPRIAGDGIAPDRIGALADRNGFAVAEPGDLSATVLVMDGMTTQRLEEVVGVPYGAFVEFREEEEALVRHIAAAAPTADDGGSRIYLALTTPTAFSQVDSAKIVCDVLVARGALPLPMRASVEMALHETIANGLLHGNLQTNIGLKDETEFYAAFCDHLKQLLENPDAHRRWIEVCASWDPDGIDLAVEDEGEGYDIENDPAEAQKAATHGRGLAIVHALATRVSVSRGGRRTSLRFDYEL